VGRDADRQRDAEFTAFVAACGARLYRTAHLLTGDQHRAADLVQESLERAYLRWEHIQCDDPIAYVRRIMVNRQYDWWRRRTHSHEWLTAAPPDTAAPGDMAAHCAQRALVLEALRHLTARERTVVVLRFYEDLNEAAIAAEVGVALGTVKSTLARALGKLRVRPEFRDDRRIEAP
jgi:RNA polymerase sigma-70 factor (sigma-E family)